MNIVTADVESCLFGQYFIFKSFKLFIQFDVDFLHSVFVVSTVIIISPKNSRAAAYFFFQSLCLLRGEMTKFFIGTFLLVVNDVSLFD